MHVWLSVRVILIDIMTAEANRSVNEATEEIAGNVCFCSLIFTRKNTRHKSGSKKMVLRSSFKNMLWLLLVALL